LASKDAILERKREERNRRLRQQQSLEHLKRLVDNNHYPSVDVGHGQLEGNGQIAPDTYLSEQDAAGK
jgi:hypothetical protein